MFAADAPLWLKGIAAILSGIGFLALAAFAPFAPGKMAQRQQVLRNKTNPWVAPVAILALFLLPRSSPMPALGPGGALKWINNYGIQILIFVMLGWGLNIVVGLAGLLDLGYVAFYAVGAYTYALLAATFGLSFWICLPLAGILAAFWGIILGFPVLRLRGDYLAIVTLASARSSTSSPRTGWISRTATRASRAFRASPSSACRSPTATAASPRLLRAEPNSSPIHRTIFLFYVILCDWRC